MKKDDPHPQLQLLTKLSSSSNSARRRKIMAKCPVPAQSSLQGHVDVVRKPGVRRFS